MKRLRELCEEICAKRERVLVFTQFREMVGPLDDFCRSIFEKPGVQLHGGTAVAKRKERVARFQNEDEYVPYFVLSVKAGGIGLNLTAATHVIHFDRWWNPARENQATDRVHRIGQRRFVQVFKLITRDTIEERIDELIRAKIDLMERVVAPTEDVISGLGRSELIELLNLEVPEQK